MASKLEESTKTAKKIGIGCLVLIIAILLFNFISGLIKPEEPPLEIYPTADEKFGELPQVSFQSQEVPKDSQPEYKVETVDEKLPHLAKRANVYKTKTPYQSLTAQDDAVAVAKALQFEDTPQALSATQLKWTRGARTLIIDKLYRTATLTTDFSKDPEAQKPHEILPDYNYTDTARNLLNNAGLFPDEYEESVNASVTLLRLNASNTLEKASSASEANFVRVDFFKQVEALGIIVSENLSDKQKEQLEQYRIKGDLLTTNPYEGLIYIIFGGTKGPTDIYKIQYVNWEVETYSVYNLSKVEEAWEKIKNNEGYLQSLFEINGDPYAKYSPVKVASFLLTNVELAYYCNLEYPQYIQPIYKFSGIALIEEDSRQTNFIFYYPAISSE